MKLIHTEVEVSSLGYTLSKGIILTFKILNSIILTIKKGRMKEKILLIFSTIIILGLTFSCGKDDNYIDRSQEDNQVKTVIKSNSPDAVIRVLGLRSGGEILSIKDYWEEEVSTKSYGGQTIATCNDAEVLITIEKYVNGKLKDKVSGNSRVVANIVIKDDFRKTPR